jgi:hypothetical protein
VDFKPGVYIVPPLYPFISNDQSQYKKTNIQHEWGYRSGGLGRSSKQSVGRDGASVPRECAIDVQRYANCSHHRDSYKQQPR